MLVDGIQETCGTKLENEPVFHQVKTASDFDKLPGQGDCLIHGNVEHF